MASPFIEGSRSRTIDVDGPVHYADLGGSGDGPLVVGIHGLGGSHLNWTALSPLLPAGCRMLALDLVGHGLTPVGTRRATVEGHRRLVSGFLRAIGSPVILVGNSMGGLVAALQAAEEPETVSGLILIDPALPTERLGLVHPRVVANFLVCAVPGVGETYLTQRRRRTTAEQTVRRVLATVCFSPERVPASVVEDHIELTERLDRAQGDAAYLRSARSLSYLLARPAETMGRLSNLTQPTLLLHGARDVLVPLTAALRMSRAHPEWRFDVAPNAGHAPMLEAAEWSASSITRWLTHEGAEAAAATRGSGHGQTGSTSLGGQGVGLEASPSASGLS